MASLETNGRCSTGAEVLGVFCSSVVTLWHVITVIYTPTRAKSDSFGQKWTKKTCKKGHDEHRLAGACH